MRNNVLNMVIMRSFLLQGCWNFERMQNLGFCYALMPALSKIYGKGEELRKALQRHLEFFNTHPFMAAPILGAVVRMEEDLKNGLLEEGEIRDFKSALMGPYGAVGDSFFWGAVKPLASVAGVIAASMGQIYAPLVFLMIYNVPHLAMRIWGFYSGYEKGAPVVDSVINLDLPAKVKRVRGVAISLAGVLLALLVFPLSGEGVSGNAPLLLTLIAIISILGLSYSALRRGMSLLPVYIAFGVSLALSGAIWFG